MEKLYSSTKLLKMAGNIVENACAAYPTSPLGSVPGCIIGWSEKVFLEIEKSVVLKSWQMV